MSKRKETSKTSKNNGLERHNESEMREEGYDTST